MKRIEQEGRGAAVRLVAWASIVALAILGRGARRGGAGRGSRGDGGPLLQDAGGDPARSTAGTSAPSSRTVPPGTRLARRWRPPCPALEEFRGRLGESPETLASALQMSFDISRQLGTSTSTPGRACTPSSGTPDAQGLFAAAQGLASKVQEATAFIDPEIVRIPRGHAGHVPEVPGPRALRPLHRQRRADPGPHPLPRGRADPRRGQPPRGRPPGRLPEPRGQRHRVAVRRVRGRAGQGRSRAVRPTGDRQRPRRPPRRPPWPCSAPTPSSPTPSPPPCEGASSATSGWRGPGATTPAWTWPSTPATSPGRSSTTSSAPSTTTSTQIQGYGKLRKKLLGLDDLHIYDMYVNLLPGPRQALHLRGGLGAGHGVLEGDLRPRVRGGGGARAARALDRRLHQRGQAARGLRLGDLRLPPLPAPQLEREAGWRLDPGPRDGPRDPQVPGQREPALPRLGLRASSWPRWPRWPASRSSSSGCSRAATTPSSASSSSTTR